MIDYALVLPAAAFCAASTADRRLSIAGRSVALDSSRVYRARALLLALAAVLAFTGCASVESVKQAKGQGIKRTFRQPSDAVFEVVLTVAARRKLELVEQDRAAGRIVFSSGASFSSLGERIGVFITRGRERSTGVEIVSEAVGGAFTFPPDWPNILFGDIEHELAVQKLK